MFQISRRLACRQGEVDGASRRTKAWSRLLRRPWPDRDAIVLLHPLQQVADLQIRVPVASRSPGPLAEEGIGLVEEQDAVGPFGRVEDLVQVLLGFPMYLLTRPASSVLNTCSPSSPATISAAIVLPVPEPPLNSALIPLPRERLSPKPQVPITRSRWMTRWQSSRSCCSVASGTTRSSHRCTGSIRVASVVSACPDCFRAAPNRSLRESVTGAAEVAGPA